VTGSRVSRGCAGLLAAVVLGAGGLLLAPAPASAHAGLVRATPADGSVVRTAPSKVVLVFDENVRSPATVVVSGPGGEHVQLGTPQVLDNTVTAPVQATGQGVYHVAFRVVSADGHPVAGETTFQYATDPNVTSLSQGGGTGAEHAGSGHDESASGGFSSGRVVGLLAVAALLVGLALLTVRRLPGGFVHPDRKDRP
jgi:hypothetical protein